MGKQESLHKVCTNCARGCGIAKNQMFVQAFVKIGDTGRGGGMVCRCSVYDLHLFFISILSLYYQVYTNILKEVYCY